MQGRKPSLKNVVPMRPDRDAAEVAREQQVAKAIRKLTPKGLNPDLRAEFVRVAKLLADPTVDRFKPRFVDTILEYCIATLRLRGLRSEMPTLHHEVYRVKSRNGDQVKTHPYVAQVNETWRQWRSLVAMLGLSPTDERGLLPGQGDLFDETEKFFG